MNLKKMKSNITSDHDHDHHQPNKPKRARRRTTSQPSIKCNKNADSNSNSNNSSRRSSIYRGVTRHRWTGRYEAHLWDKSCWNSIQSKKGKQGAYDSEEDAARTYDLAALKYWGPHTILNFPTESYTKELEEMQNVTKEEYLASLRRQSSGFSRGVSKYRGVARHHHNGRWEARIGRVFGNKYLYLGTFSSQEDAARAYDLAAIEYRGTNAVTNFDINNYIGLVKNFMPNDQPQQPDPNSFIKANVMEGQQDQQQEEQQQQEVASVQSQESLELANSNHSSPSTLLMVSDQGSEDPWNFCLDTSYDTLLFPEIPLEEEAGELLDLLDQTCFEDNIVDLIFEGEPNEEYLGGDQLDKNMENPFSSASPTSSSTTASVLC
ncbi:hypothetical protein Ancab_001105 [Ancistrocladus abbreviatus]